MTGRVGPFSGLIWATYEDNSTHARSYLSYFRPTKSRDILNLYFSAPNFLHWNTHIFLFGLILRDISNSITPQTTLRLLPIPVGLLGIPCTRQCRWAPLTPFFFLLSRTEELVKAGTCARDRHALQLLALNVHVKHSDLTWQETEKRRVIYLFVSVALSCLALTQNQIL